MAASILICTSVLQHLDVKDSALKENAIRHPQRQVTVALSTMMMQIYRSLAAALFGLGAFSGFASAFTPVSAAAGAIASPVHGHQHPGAQIIENCDDQGVTCAHEFAKVVTVYEYNVTSAIVNWVTTEVVLEPATVTSTSIVVVTTTQGVETDALCEKTVIISKAGPTTITVHLNATHVNTIRPTVTSTKTETLIQTEKSVSVCLIQSTHNPLPPAVSGGVASASGLPSSSQQAAGATSGGASSSSAASSAAASSSGSAAPSSGSSARSSSTSSSRAQASSGSASSSTRTQSSSSPRDTT
ncbi:hypothetical protein V8F20_001421 [Naviculisporaceae sp. PSN 640]